MSHQADTDRNRKPKDPECRITRVNRTRRGAACSSVVSVRERYPTRGSASLAEPDVSQDVSMWCSRAQDERVRANPRERNGREVETEGE